MVAALAGKKGGETKDALVGALKKLGCEEKQVLVFSSPNAMACLRAKQARTLCRLRPLYRRFASCVGMTRRPVYDLRVVPVV
jgi:hypothetical protein